MMANVFRFVQAGSKVSDLLGRLPLRVGYQPTLASEVAALQERIVSVGGVASRSHNDPVHMAVPHARGRRLAVTP